MNTMVTAVIAITMGRSNVVITEESHNTLRHRVTTATTIVPTKDWLAVSSVAFWATNWGETIQSLQVLVPLPGHILVME